MTMVKNWQVWYKMYLCISFPKPWEIIKLILIIQQIQSEKVKQFQNFI